MAFDIFTVGHSTQSGAQFIERLKHHGIMVVADVRSAPYSRHNPQFNREALRSELKEHGIRYLFMGKELGARSEDECCYVGDKVQYDLLARTTLFQSGVSRVLDGSEKYKIAMMCAEKEPLECHRTILIARELERRGARVVHILEDGSAEAHPCTMLRLVDRLGISSADMFRSERATLEEAYSRQADRIAFNRGSSRSENDDWSASMTRQSRY